MILAGPDRVLVSFDTDRIKEYVFASGKLAEIRGASAILDHLNRVETQNAIGKENVIFAGGGSALAIVEKSKAGPLIEQVERMYRKSTGSAASITGVSVDYCENAFNDVFRRASSELRRKKNERQALENVVTLPHLVPCESCGRYPAEDCDEPSGDMICRPCLLKRECGREEHHGKVGLMSRFLQAVAGRPGWEAADLAQDFNEIGRVSEAPGYLGLIYCDGNRMGDLLMSLRTRQDYQQFSRAVDSLLWEITVETLVRCLPPRRVPGEERTVLPFEIIMVGGDDLVLVTAADAVLDAACTIAAEFEKRSRGLVGDQKLSLSAGVAIAHADYPFYATLEVAEELLKSAKMLSFQHHRQGENHGGYQGAIDFMVLTGATGVDVKRLRSDELSYWDGEEQVNLTERPYSIEQLQSLIRQIRELRDCSFPGNKLQALYESLFKGKNAAMYEAMVALGRLSKDQHKYLSDFFREWGVDVPPWRKRGRINTSPLGDLVEAYAFVGSKGGGPNE